MTSQLLKIKLLDRNYSVRCAEQESDTLQQAADFLAKRVSETQAQGNLPFTDAVVVAALNICGELIKLKQNPPSQDNVHLPQRILEKLQALEEEVNAVMATES